jgi:hypothetical protein
MSDSIDLKLRGYQTPAQTAQEPENPRSYEEAHWFQNGFIAGATAYAAVRGDSTLKTTNQHLRVVFDTQSWKTIEAYERTPPMAPQLDEKVKQWLGMNQKTEDQVRHGTFPLGMVQGWIDRAERAEREFVSAKASLGELQSVVSDANLDLDKLGDLLADSSGHLVGQTSAVTEINRILDVLSTLVIRRTESEKRMVADQPMRWDDWKAEVNRICCGMTWPGTNIITEQTDDGMREYYDQGYTPQAAVDDMIKGVNE